MGGGDNKLEVTTTQSDIKILREQGFTLEKVVGEGSYAKVNLRSLICRPTLVLAGL